MNDTTPPSPSRHFAPLRGYIFLFSMLALMSCADKPAGQQKPIGTMFTKDGELTLLRASGDTVVTIEIEIRDTPQERETGMMGRPTLGEQRGMFFVFEEEQFLSFWMLNTMIPLDMLFIGADGKIVTIHRNTVPYSQQSYGSTTPGRFVLEVNAGFCERYGIVEGDSVEWSMEKK